MNGTIVDSPFVMVRGSVDVLSEILWPEVQLALWERPRPETLDWLDTHDWDEVDDIDAVMPRGDLSAALRAELHVAAYPQSPQGAALFEEILGHARRFCALMTCAALRLRLEIVETDACRKFHADHVRARLLLTLSGQGTQWMQAMGDPQQTVRQMAAGDVGIFKGRLWAEEPGILHRSPPIAHKGERRLLLVLDVAGDKL